MNWKWLFIYPDYGVASVNQLAVPVDTPIAFKLTAHSLMNSFFIPQLGSQIYAMPGMQTQLHLIANHAGAYDGMSAAYSGHGFSGMNFKAAAMTRADFDGWLAQARKSSETLSHRHLPQARGAQRQEHARDLCEGRERPVRRHCSTSTWA
jgi:cytochrome o ubiquinol oxidase subunit 2